MTTEPRRKPWADRASRHARGYGAAWEKLRALRLKLDNYLCQRCLKRGRVTPATNVDHVLAKAHGGEDSLENTQSLCDDCKVDKDREDRGESARDPGFTDDGLPVWG